ncbi:hypothetical protein [Providencia huaxiensis]
MSLQIVNDFYGLNIATDIAIKMEYIWNQNPKHDPFEKVII